MKKSQHRLAFLLMEGEPSHNLSTRKLLLESAKHTVINAYGSEEGVELFRRFSSNEAISSAAVSNTKWTPSTTWI